MEGSAHPGSMFLIDCAACGRRRLVGARSIAGIVNAASGIEVHLDCTCGHRSVQCTGRTPARRAALATAA